MRILCVGTAYPPHGSGGYELQCAGFVAHARAAGHDVRVLTALPRTGADPSWLRAGAFRALQRFPAEPAVAVCAETAERSERWNAGVLRHHVATFAPDVVCWWRLGELSMSLVGSTGVPEVGMVCDPWMVDGPRRDPWARLQGSGPDVAAARWLFVSHALRERLRAAGLPVEGPVVHAGVEPLAAVSGARAWGWELLCAGRLSPLKGADVAVRALAELPSARLRLVGAGTSAQGAALRALAAEVGVSERLVIEPARPRAAMAALYESADAVLFPVRWEEPFGLVPLEAMAVGRPVVATGTGGSAEYLRDGVNALLAGPGDVAALAAAVRRLAAEADLRAALVAEGRRTAAAFPAARSHDAVLAALWAAAHERSAA